MIKPYFLVAALLSSTLGFLQAQGQSALTGKVVSQDGKPGEAAEISRFWVLGTSDANGARAYGSVRADSAGHFSLPLEPKDLPVDLVVYAVDRKTAAVVHASAFTQPLEVVLLPVSRIRVTAQAPSLGGKLSGTRFLLQSTAGVTLGQLSGNDAEFPFPKGDFQLLLSSADTSSTVKPLHVVSGRRASLHFNLALSAMAKHFGKQPPSLMGLVDGQNRPVPMPQFDRPTLLYFWADWCQPCIAEGIPHLLQFAEAHKGERFQIVAIHENGIPAPSTTAAFQHSLERLQESVWKQRLSFPFAFDASGKVTSAWGLSTFPTYALVDAQGKLKPEAGLEQLENLMKK